MALQIDDQIRVDGRISVPGIEDGFTYTVTGFKTFRERPHYIMQCDDTAEYVKVPVTELDDVVGTSNTVEIVS